MPKRNTLNPSWPLKIFGSLSLMLFASLSSADPLILHATDLFVFGQNTEVWRSPDYSLNQGKKTGVYDPELHLSVAQDQTRISPREEITMRVRTSRTYAQYVIEISKSRRFNPQQTTLKRIFEPKLKQSFRDQGTYYLRVFGVEPSGRTSEVSPATVVQVYPLKLNSPPETPREFRGTLGKPLEISWTKPTADAEIEIQIFDARDQLLISKTTQMDFMNFSPKQPGLYRLQIRTKNNDLRSPIRWASILISHPLGLPELLKVKVGHEFSHEPPDYRVFSVQRDGDHLNR